MLVQWVKGQLNSFVMICFRSTSIVRFAFWELKSLARIFGFVGAVLLAGLSAVQGQDFSIDEITVDRVSGEVRVTPVPAPGFYNVLAQGETVDAIDEPFLISLNAEFKFLSEPGDRFFRVKWISLNDPEDQDGDGIPDTFEVLFAFLDPFDSSDAELDFDEDGASNRREFEEGTNPSLPDQITSLGALSPTDGESGVAVTRESIVYFTAPLQTEVPISSEAFYAEFGGERLPGRIQRSSDGSKLTLFYNSILPPSARVRLNLDGSLLTDKQGVAVDVDGDGEPGGFYSYSFDTLSLTFISGTAVCGRVFASELVVAENGNETLNRPLEGVVVTVDGMEETLITLTDQNGNFRLDDAPVGRFFVHIDGRTAVAEIQEGAYYPFVGKAWESIPGEEVNVGEIYLPLVVAGALQPVSVEEDTTIEFPAQVQSEFPEFANVAITVPGGSLQYDDGRPGGSVGIAPVPPDRLPGQLPPGLNFPLVITVQTDGATNFDTPAPVCFPNLPDPSTGEPLPPGAKSALWSFNHDTGRFEVVGPMTVSGDGTVVCTDPGVGILAPGWHGVLSGVQGVGGPIVGGNNNLFFGLYEPGTHSRAPNAPCPTGDCPPAKVADSGSTAADPIHLYSGEFYLEVTDLIIPGRGMDFNWSRKYRSRIEASSALGNQWDYSFNIWIQEMGNQILLADGNSRRDLFNVRSDGTLTRQEFFQDFVEVAEGEYHLVYPDQSRWEFHPFDGSAFAGKISSIVDRHGNRMQLNYDDAGRLVEVVDTLDRPIAIGWNGAGLIESVTDFSGRTIIYDYYVADEEGGSPGDLKSVTSPAVTGTPNGNDFENGKTVSYTYSVGLSDPSLNHNLLTITDGRRNDPLDPTFGTGPYLVNVYSETTESNDIQYDRVIRQTWGDPGDIVDFYYETILPSNANGMAVTKAIVNDRNGNVTESFYDARNRITRYLEFTGRADADRVTTSALNRPMEKLREDDPAFYITQYQWNEDSQLKRITYPNGSSKLYVYESDINPSADSRSRGNLRETHTFNGRLAVEADQEVLSEFFEYGDGFENPCCAFNFVTRYTDARGSVMVHEYDDQGNRVRTVDRMDSVVMDFDYNSFGQLIEKIWPDNGSGHRRRDVMSYYESGPQRGYLESEMLDADGERLVDRYEYDAVGNLVRLVDARGNDQLMTVNELNQVVRLQTQEVVDGFRYTKDFFYDANDNLVRTDTINLDHSLTEQENTHFTETYDFELLNYVVRHTQEVSESRNVVTEYAYDANRNRTTARYGEAVSGAQPGNRVDYEYDERNLLFRTVSGPGTDDQSTTEYGYDLSGNLSRSSVGLENAPRVSMDVFDGFDRLVRSMDPMGNLTEFQYDPNGNLIRRSVFGELLDEPGNETPVLLSSVEHEYDPLNRRIVDRRSFFETGSQELIDDGSSETQYTFSANSQVTSRRNDRGNGFDLIYDTMNRAALMVDNFGNQLSYEYDENSNVIRTTETEISSDSSVEEVFVTQFTFDPLNRKTRMVDPAGQVTDYGYDSRHNLSYTADGRRISEDQPGNTVVTLFDGVNRPMQVERFLTESGMGGSNSIGSIVTQTLYDDSSRLVAQIDDAGNQTSYQYDPLNRATKITYADGSFHSMEYDPQSNVTRKVDANGTVVVREYDLLDRNISNSITPATGVDSNLVSESFAYDGLSRMVRAEDSDAIVLREFDSLSNLVRESINGREVRVVYDGEGNSLETVYPGGRTIRRTFDELERATTFSDDAGWIAENQFLGSSRLLSRTNRNGTRVDFGFDAIKRVASVDHIHQISGDTGVLFETRAFVWDGASNKVTTERFDPVPWKKSWNYDSIHRMTAVTYESGDSIPRTQVFDFDTVGNRETVIGLIPGSSSNEEGTYLLDNTLPEPADLPVHQYTAVPTGSNSFDANGNLIEVERDGNSVAVTYDYRNQMTQFGETQYQYDPIGRRISKKTSDTSETLYSYLGWQVLEEQNQDGVTLATYVYGNFMDEPIEAIRGGQEYFYHLDDQYSVLAITDSSGDVTERYVYGAYGERSVTDASGAPLVQSVVENPLGFQGRRLDGESGWYYYRHRYLDAVVGRFTVRDPIGIWGSPENIGNGYTFVGNNPQSHLDPMGLDRELVMSAHAYITVDVYDKDGNKTGQRDLHFAPEGSGNSDWTIKRTRDRLFYHNWAYRVKVRSSMAEDQALIREWIRRNKNKNSQTWNPLNNCWWASLSSYGIGAKISDRSIAQKAGDLAEDLYVNIRYGAPELPKAGEASIRPYEPSYLEQAKQSVDQGLEYLEKEVAQPIVDFFDDPKPTLDSWGSTIKGWFK